MAQPYFDRLTAKLSEADLSIRGVALECRHFFGGAALYANDKIFASLTPAGLAVKLPEQLKTELLHQRRGRPLRYFKEGPVKKEYLVLTRATASNLETIRELFREGIRHVTREGGARASRQSR